MSERVDQRKLQSKPSALAELLRVYRSVSVHVDARVEGSVPEHLRGLSHVVFELSTRMPSLVSDLEIDEFGWSARLSYGGERQLVIILWAAVFLLVSDTGVGSAWPVDAPPGILIHRLPGVEHQAPPPCDDERRVRLPPRWRVLDGGRSKRPARLARE